TPRLLVEPVLLGPPRSSEPNPHGIAALPHQVGHIGGLMHQPVDVVGPPRLEHPLIHIDTIDTHLIRTSSRGIQRGMLHLCPDLELPPGQTRSSRPGWSDDSHKLRGPLLIGEEPALQPQWLTPG